MYHTLFVCAISHSSSLLYRTGIRGSEKADGLRMQQECRSPPSNHEYLGGPPRDHAAVCQDQANWPPYGLESMSCWFG